MKYHHTNLVRTRGLLSFIMLLLPIAASLHAAALYKWIDEDGQIRYSDQLPPQQVTKKHQKLNAQGVVTESKEAARTAEEIEAEKKLQQELDARAAIEKQANAAQNEKDQVLLLTFSSEKELTAVKDNRIEVIDAVIRLIDNSISVTEERLNDLKISADTNYISKNLEVPGGLAQNIEFFTRKVINRQSQLKLKQKEKDKINQQYELDLERYRFLKSK